MSVRSLAFAGVVTASLAASVSAADAQSSPAPVSTAASTVQLGPDPTAIYTLEDENASLSSASLTDRYYVNGLKAGYTSGTDGVPDFAASIGHALYGDGEQHLTFDLTQQIYTPADASSFNPPANDRPYAGVLLANLGVITDSDNTRSTIQASAGVVGPWALGEQIQNGFHDLISQSHNNGWHYQLRNEAAVELLSSRIWRLPVMQFAGFETDSLIDASAGVGNVRIYGEGGAQLRFGQGLASDFGTSRLRPGISGGDAFKPTRPFAWYVFVGADGQGVAHDITIQGNDFESSRSVKIKPLVGELEGGLALMAFGTRLTYTHVLQSQEFQHQKGGLHQFGSLALSVRF